MVERPPLKPYRILPRAEADLTSAFDHYEGQEPGLGLEFLRSFEAALSMLRRYPEAAPRVRGEVRRTLLRRFPHGVFYDERHGKIRVLAVLHVRRDSAGWPR
jgi:plasmid stabilization system protein ParE